MTARRDSDALKGSAALDETSVEVTGVAAAKNGAYVRRERVFRSRVDHVRQRPVLGGDHPLAYGGWARPPRRIPGYTRTWRVQEDRRARAPRHHPAQGRRRREPRASCRAAGAERVPSPCEHNPARIVGGAICSVTHPTVTATRPTGRAGSRGPRASPVEECTEAWGEGFACLEARRRCGDWVLLSGLLDRAPVHAAGFRATEAVGAAAGLLRPIGAAAHHEALAGYRARRNALARSRRRPKGYRTRQ